MFFDFLTFMALYVVFGELIIHTFVKANHFGKKEINKKDVKILKLEQIYL